VETEEWLLVVGPSRPAEIGHLALRQLRLVLRRRGDRARRYERAQRARQKAARHAAKCSVSPGNGQRVPHGCPTAVPRWQVSAVRARFRGSTSERRSIQLRATADRRLSRLLGGV